MKPEYERVLKHGYVAHAINVPTPRGCYALKVYSYKNHLYLYKYVTKRNHQEGPVPKLLEIRKLTKGDFDINARPIVNYFDSPTGRMCVVYKRINKKQVRCKTYTIDAQNSMHRVADAILGQFVEVALC